MKFKKKDKDGVFKSLFVAYFVLLLHVFLLAGTGVTIVLFKGVYNYLPWILGGLAAFMLLIFLIIYFRIKKSTKDIKDVLSIPEFQDRNVEIKLLGGIASFKIDGKNRNDNGAKLLTANGGMNGHLPLLEEKHHTIDQRISNLAELYKSGLITDEEFGIAKSKIFDEP